MDNYHITKEGDKWKLQKEGNRKPTKTAGTKADLLDRPRSLCLIKKHQSKFIHQMAGSKKKELIRGKMIPKRRKGKVDIAALVAAIFLKFTSV
ncbi:DUF2188 domain-containing protein [Cronobacter turicensis]